VVYRNSAQLKNTLSSSGRLKTTDLMSPNKSIDFRDNRPMGIIPSNSEYLLNTHKDHLYTKNTKDGIQNVAIEEFVADE
jgi:hypothetical protein